MFRFKRFLRGSKGANAVEFALIAPVFLLLLFGMIEFGLIFSDWLILTNGVREGARAGVVVNGILDEKRPIVEDAVNNYTGALGGPDTITLSCLDADGNPDDTCPSGDSSLMVGATHTRSLITPIGAFMAWFGGSMGDEVTLSASSEMRNE